MIIVISLLFIHPFLSPAQIINLNSDIDHTDRSHLKFSIGPVSSLFSSEIMELMRDNEFDYRVDFFGFITEYPLLDRRGLGAELSYYYPLNDKNEVGVSLYFGDLDKIKGFSRGGISGITV